MTPPQVWAVVRDGYVSAVATLCLRHALELREVLAAPDARRLLERPGQSPVKIVRVRARAWVRLFRYLRCIDCAHEAGEALRALLAGDPTGLIRLEKVEIEGGVA